MRDEWKTPEEKNVYDPDARLLTLWHFANECGIHLAKMQPIIPVGHNPLKVVLDWSKTKGKEAEAWQIYRDRIDQVATMLGAKDSADASSAKKRESAEDFEGEIEAVKTGEAETTPTKREQMRIEYIRSDLGQRDQFIYEKRKAEMTNTQVIDQLEKIFSEKCWEHVTTAQSIRNAVNRWCIKTGASPLDDVKAGRPKSKNPQAKNAK